MLRIRLRGPHGQQTCELPAHSTISDLQHEIRQRSGFSQFSLKSGYPPKELDLSKYSLDDRLDQLDLKLNGEQLTVSDATKNHPADTDSNTHRLAKKFLDADEASDQDSPEVPVPEYNGTMVLRVMPDDNSCLFRAFNSAFFGAMDNMIELRSIIAQTIQASPDQYTKAVLDKDPAQYCAWIQTDSAWGGAIELSILSQHFDIEICSIDVQTLRVDRFNEGQAQRCILVYSGIHYDCIGITSTPLNPPEFDTKIFSAADPVVLAAAEILCRRLQAKHYYTDTANFKVKCNVCSLVFTGEAGASQHAMQTRHYDFGEARD